MRGLGKQGVGDSKTEEGGMSGNTEDEMGAVSSRNDATLAQPLGPASRLDSGRRPEIPSNDSRVPRRNSKQCDGLAFGAALALLPIPRSVAADLNRASEVGLSQPDEAPQRSDVLAGLEAVFHSISVGLRRGGE